MNHSLLHRTKSLTTYLSCNVQHLVVPEMLKNSARPIVLFTDSLIPIVFTSKFTDADTDSFTIAKQTWQ